MGSVVQFPIERARKPGKRFVAVSHVFAHGCVPVVNYVQQGDELVLNLACGHRALWGNVCERMKAFPQSTKCPHGCVAFRVLRRTK